VRSNAGCTFERNAFDRTMCVRPQKIVTAQPGSDGLLGHQRKLRDDTFDRAPAFDRASAFERTKCGRTHLAGIQIFT
jgi:hypothetical protein